MPRTRLLVLVALAAAFLAAPSARADTFFDVDSFADAHDATPGDGVCAIGVDQPCTLRAAIEEANALGGDDFVSVPGGSYQLTIAAGGALEITDNLTIQGFSDAVIKQENPGPVEGDRVFDIAPPSGGPAPFVVLAGLTIQNGQAHARNGFFGGDVRSSGNLTIRNSTISGGTGDSAGGIANVAGTLIVESSTISGNVAPTSPAEGGDAGAILNIGGGVEFPATLELRNSTVSGNTAKLAGGIFSYGSTGNTVTVESSTITENRSGIRGGAGGLEIGSGSATVRNSIVAGNSGSGPNCHAEAPASVTSQGHNLESGSECGFKSTGDLQGVDPLLGALKTDFGPMQTHALLEGSPAIDAGADEQSGDCPFEDQRGIGRPRGDACDIGAYEAGPSAAKVAPAASSFALTGASFTALPPSGTPAAVETGSLASFPTHGSSFLALSTGDARFVRSGSGGGSDDNLGDNVRGDTDQDVTVLRLDFDVPAGANCASFDFRFLSNEDPGDTFNDAFIAELDSSTWTTNNTAIDADRNFAFDPSGDVISVNALGDTQVTAAEAEGTSFEVATPLLRASSQVTPGAHSLFLSIFDQGDRIVDSAVLVDNLRVTTESPSNCKPGAVVKQNGQPPPPPPPPDNDPPETSKGAGPATMVEDESPTFTFSASEAGASFECSLDGQPFGPCSSPYTLSGLAAGPHTLRVRAVDSNGNADPSPAEFAFAVAAQLQDLPAPTVGKEVNVAAVKGQVLVAVPAGGAAHGRGAHASQKGLKFVPLEEARQIPTGSFLDTSHGTVQLVSATGARSKTQDGKFAAGIFQVLQSRKKRDKGLTELRLKGGNFKSCRRGHRGKRASAAKVSRRTLRQLKANAHGRFRTRGNHSAATVRGTAWVTADRCDGTLTKVTRGTVAVRDFRRKKTVLVRAGKSYLARAPR